MVEMEKKKKTRRTLKDIKYYPTPAEIFNIIMSSEGWPYKQDREFYLKRDRALVALLYLLALRISEALRLKKSQFLFPEDTGHNDRIIVRGIKLSKSRVKGKPRRDQYRQENWLPLVGPRAKLTQFVLEYLKELKDDELLFPFNRTRAWQIIHKMTGATCHWFRAFGEDFLYSQWDKDLLAVSDYVKVDPRTLSQYIRRRYEKYKAI
jgi:integrase